MFVNIALADTDTLNIQQSSEEVIPTTEGPSHTIKSGITSLIPIVLIFVVFYFLLIRPQEKKRRAQESLISGVKVGEEILTTAGIYGVVIKINDNDNNIILKVADNVELKILKSSIADITNRYIVDVSSDKKVIGKSKKKKYIAKDLNTKK